MFNMETLKISVLYLDVENWCQVERNISWK